VKNPDDIDQINCVKLLLLHYDVFGNRKYLSAKEMMYHLNTGRENEIKDQQFRRIIGKLRDQGVIVASRSKGDEKGYRLPTSQPDLLKFVEHGNSIAFPILHRIKICRDKIKLATNNQLDIISYPQFDTLREIIEITYK
jgi:hypothetical protein